MTFGQRTPRQGARLIEHFFAGLGAQHARPPESGVVGALLSGQCASVRGHCPLTGFETPHFESNNWLFLHDFAGFFDKTAAIFDALDIERQHMGEGIGGDGDEHVGLADIGLIAQADQP